MVKQERLDDELDREVEKIHKTFDKATEVEVNPK